MTLCSSTYNDMIAHATLACTHILRGKNQKLTAQLPMNREGGRLRNPRNGVCCEIGRGGRIGNRTRSLWSAGVVVGLCIT